MSDKKIIKLNGAPKGFGDIADELTQDMFESAIPTQHSHSYYENDELGLYIGVWDTTDMVETAAPYGCDEFMVLLEGQATIKNNQTDELETIVAGESFVIPKGYNCQWQQTGYLRKFYVISEHPDENIPTKPTVESVVYITDNETAFTATSDGFEKKELYIDQHQRFSSGIWRCKTLTTELAPFPDNEFLLINQGSLTCLDENNVAQTFNAGDALFIPQGTVCAWQVTTNVSLTYVKIK